MGILDFLDNPSSLSNLLGWDMGNMQSPQTPQPGVMAPDPSGGGGMAPPLPPVDPRRAMASSPPMPPGNAVPLNPTTPDFSGPNGGGGVPLPTPDPRAANASAVPLPPPRPTEMSAPGPASSIDLAARAGGMPAPAPMQLGQMTPPLPPATTGDGAPQTMTQGGRDWRAMFGLDPNSLRSTLSGVGRGLSAVGQLRPGASAGQAFAAGAGGGLQGMTSAQEKQKNDLFNQSSTAFKDMLAAKTSDNTAEYRAAQAKYLAARAQSLMTGGSANGTRAWQNTPYGRTIQVENEAQKYEKGQQILLAKKWQLNGATPEQQQQDLDNLAKSVDGYRQKLYKQIGVDPSQADKLKDMGTSAQNPFDTKGMTLEQFHQMVPMGGWFKDQNGVVRQRTVPPPGYGATQAAPANPAVNADDMTAMQPAG